MTRIHLIGAISLFGLVACTADDADAPDSGDPAGGKADDNQDVDDASLSVRIAKHDSEDRVETNCHGESGFVAKALCEEAGLFERFTDATSCPERMSIRKPEGAQQGAHRCVDADTGDFVASACCSPLCSPDAAWDGDSCRANGAFEDALCCFLADAQADAACEGAAWETFTVEHRGERVRRAACRNEDTGQFALNTCCASHCLDAIGEEGVSAAPLPGACLPDDTTLTAPSLECPADAAPNSANLCHNPANGQFLAAACCEARRRTETDRGAGRRDELDREGSDRCFRDPEGCLTDEFVCSFNHPSALGETTDDLDDSAGATLRPGDELTDHQAAVLHAAAQLHFGVSRQGEDTDVLFEIDDEETIIISEFEVRGQEISWIKFFAGDNEVGFLFTKGNEGRVTVVAEVSDGDLKGCRRAEEDVCPADVDEEVVICMQDWLSDDVGIDPDEASTSDLHDAADFCRESFFSDSSFFESVCSDSFDGEGCFDERLDQAEGCFQAIIDADGFDGR